MHTTITSNDTLVTLLPSAVERHGDRVAARHRDGAGWRDVSYAEVGNVVSAIALGLIELGVSAGERLAILAATRPEWTYADCAISMAGGVVVPVYPTNSPEECEWVLGDSDAVAVICENAAQVERVLSVRARPASRFRPDPADWTNKSKRRYDQRITVSEPPTDKGRATRERVLDAATALMFERGVASTTLDDVRATASVSKSQLYHYFADKDDLVRAVVDHTVQEVLDAQPRLADLSSWTAIAAWFEDLVGLQVARHAVGGCPIGSLAGELAETDQLARKQLAAGFDRWEAPLRDGLMRMRAKGKLRRGADPARLATATLASIQGGLVLTQTRRDPRQLRIALDAAYGYLRSFAA